jgi:hypothetical protein
LPAAVPFPPCTAVPVSFSICVIVTINLGERNSTFLALFQN